MRQTSGTMLIQNTGRTSVVLIALHRLDDEMLARVNVKAIWKSIVPNEEVLEQIVTRLLLKLALPLFPGSCSFGRLRGCIRRVKR